MSADALLDRAPIVQLARRAASDDVALDAEQAVLGALLIDPSAFGRIDGLGAGHFSDERHRIIFRAILDEREDSGVVDVATVGERLLANCADAQLVGYAAGLALNVPAAANVSRYAGLVREKSERRALAELGADIQERAARGDLAELRRDAEAQLERLAPRSPAAAPLAWGALANSEAPARRWAVRGWLGFGHTSLLVGTGGIGKTLLAQQLASCLALGRPFVDDIEASARVIAWCCEDDHDELWRRQVAIARWLGVGLEAFDDRLYIVPRHGMDNALIVGELGRLILTPRLIELREQADDLKADVVILDNAAQVFGASENDRHAVTLFVNALAGALPGKAILLLAHPARREGSEFSGSSAWENVVRTRLYLGSKLPDQKLEPDEQADESVRFLARRKSNYSSKDWRKFTFRDGVLVPDAIEAENPDGGIVAHLRDQAAEKVVLEGLRRLAELGLTATDGTTSPRFLPRLLHDYKLAEGHSRSDLAAAMRRLVLDGRLRVNERLKLGPDRHWTKGLEIAK